MCDDNDYYERNEALEMAEDEAHELAEENEKLKQENQRLVCEVSILRYQRETWRERCRVLMRESCGIEIGPDKGD